MNNSFETIIIGAGQAGLSIAYFLARMQHNYLILEQADIIAPAWHDRWDSFRLVLPNWTLQLPDFPYQGNDPDGFLTKAEMICYLEGFAATFDCRVRFNSRVTSLQKDPAGAGYLVHTARTLYRAANVVVATGTYQQPKIPSYKSFLAAHVHQIHSSQYKNPQQLPTGAVLVVGTGQSGCQIAEELYQSGRKVFLSVGGAVRVPRVYRGRDIVYWMDRTRFFDRPVAALPSPRTRFEANPFTSGNQDGRSLDLHQFARDGVVLLGRLTDAQANQVHFSPDLRASLEKIDLFVQELTGQIDFFIDAHGIAAEEKSNQTPLSDGYAVPIVEELNLSEQGITNIVWATGYRFDFRWIQAPVLDQYGYPLQKRGASALPGLYFVGLHWLHTLKSGLPWGVAEDAAHIANLIAAHT